MDTPVVTVVGSRNISDEEFSIIRGLTERLSRFCFIRTGGSEGADTAAEDGAGRRAIVYLPHVGYGRTYGPGMRVPYVRTRFSECFVNEIHPKPQELLQIERNFIEITGESNNDAGFPAEPSVLVIIVADTDDSGVPVGCSRYAVKALEAYSRYVPGATPIPVLNIRKPEDLELICSIIGNLEDICSRKPEASVRDLIRLFASRTHRLYRLSSSGRKPDAIQ